jgi:hypothetical protein
VAAASGSCVASVAKPPNRCGISAHGLGELVVGATGEVDGARDVGLFLDTRVEQRQDLEVDSCGVHLLES